MRYIETYGDQRQLAFCAFCGGATGTRDHCPSRVLLDKPYPENLPVVPACRTCNAGFSSDEEYFARLVSCVLAGSTEPDSIPRQKIARILRKKPALRSRIEQSRRETASEISFTPESHRVFSVVRKLAQGHALHELHEPCAYPPSEICIQPFALMSEAQRDEFESPSPLGRSIWPEVGSRALQRLVTEKNDLYDGWLEIQRRGYRFQASVPNGIEIRIVIQEYLAVLVRWE
ncbi:MAG: hypothetical protein QOJ64_2303 [Acidobacteriota bacterium]|nr:hypothetical protein [Acidobacteriota bacterium]